MGVCLPPCSPGPTPVDKGVSVENVRSQIQGQGLTQHLVEEHLKRVGFCTPCHSEWIGLSCFNVPIVDVGLHGSAEIVIDKTAAVDRDVVEPRVGQVVVQVGVNFNGNGSGSKRPLSVTNVAAGVANQIVPRVALLVKDKAHAIGAPVVVSEVHGEFQVEIGTEVNLAIVPSRSRLKSEPRGCQLHAVHPVEVGGAHSVPLSGGIKH